MPCVTLHLSKLISGNYTSLYPHLMHSNTLVGAFLKALDNGIMRVLVRSLMCSFCSLTFSFTYNVVASYPHPFVGLKLHSADDVALFVVFKCYTYIIAIVLLPENPKMEKVMVS